jgi:transcription initiation factor TFIIA large subunit
MLIISISFRTIEQAPRPVPQAPAAARAVQHQQQPQQQQQQQHQQQQQQQGASSNGMEGGQQLLITDPNRMMPVQITIPAQPGHPGSVPKALTVQVPAHALQQGTPSSSILQQVLTQAITQALNLPDSMQAALFLQAQINSAFKLEQLN